MIAGVIFILIAWFVQMPLWLSITMTVCAGLSIIMELLKFGSKLN